MSQSLSSILIHLIFSTKNREPFLAPEIDAELYPYMASIFKAMKSPARRWRWKVRVFNGPGATRFALAPGYHMARRWR